MINCLLRRVIHNFERDWNYQVGCIRDLIHATPRAAWLVSRVTGLLAIALLLAVGLAAPVLADASTQPAVTAYSLTPRRIGASLAVAVALIGAVIGGLALARSRGTGSPARVVRA